MKTGSNVSNVVPDRGAQKETTLFPLRNYQPRGDRQR